MKPAKFLLPVFSILLLISACSPPLLETPPSLPTTEPPVYTEPATPAPTVPPMTLDMLKNATYMLPFYGRTVTLTNGAYQEGSGAEIFSVSITGAIAFGDLNGDGLEDAAAILVENGGGTGQFESVVVMINQGGVLAQAGVAQLGDRVQINSLAIQAGRVLLDMLVQGPNDAMCCPTQPLTQAYQHLANGLFLMHATSKTLSGAERTITITSPANNAEVTTPVTVTGSVSMTPFENTLIYRIYKVANEEIIANPLMVEAAEMGGPGTFTLDLDLTKAGVTGPIRLEILDISMADGSTLALDAIILVLK
jgi:hypothetical protein